MNPNQEIDFKNYAAQLLEYQQVFNDYGSVVFLINQILKSINCIEQGHLPQQLPTLELPEDIQDQIFWRLKEQYPIGDEAGDATWNELTDAMPGLDKLLRSYRDYLSQTYGMWSYTSKPFIIDLMHYLHGRPALEIMAGNGYISSGLKHYHQTVFTTDALAWTDEHETGNHLVTDVEKIDALDAIDKYHDQIDFVIMAWSPDGQPIDVQVLEKLRSLEHQPTLICIGEKNGATNSKEFWQMADYIDAENTEKLNSHFKSFDLIDEKIYLIK